MKESNSEASPTAVHDELPISLFLSCIEQRDQDRIAEPASLLPLALLNMFFTLFGKRA
jgi:hypothetical protein